MAGKKVVQVIRQKAVLTLDQIKKGKVKIQRRLDELEKFDPQGAADNSSFSAEIKDKINDTLSDIFGLDSWEYDQYKSYGLYEGGSISMSMHRNPSYERAQTIQAYTKGKQKTESKLRTVLSLLDEKIEDLSYRNENDEKLDSHQKKELSKNVFIVHGHDDASKHAVARFIESLGFKAIILHEQANEGRTIIEKLEAYSDVRFAIILLSPDDYGAEQGQTANNRPDKMS